MDTYVTGAPRLLNLGCGDCVHPAFDNVDLQSRPGVIGHDLRHGIPFPDQTYDVVYHSTMLSHFRPPEALRFMQECRRVLKPGGVLRVVTEDLEQMCRVYLEMLERAWSGDPLAAANHEWMLLEMYDQAMRERSGGGMLDYLRRQPLLNEAFIRERVGEQGRIILEGVRRRREPSAEAPVAPAGGVLRRGAAALRRLALGTLLGRERVQALEIGRFRLTSGQVTYRMYDRQSLKRLMAEAGFSDMVLQTAATSLTPFWRNVNLDVAESGAPARPHALIMEARRSL
jgi:predicted SAM-dependent methyltransferase